MRLVGYVFLLGCAVPSMKVGAFSMLPTRGPFPGLVGLPQQRSVSRIARAMPLRMANQFDIAKPVFDLLSLRSVRGDALVRYDALNQSEPLRIALYAVLSFSFFSAPSISETIGYDEMNLPATITSYAMATFSVGLLYRECNRRAKQLKRIEKELNSELLEVRLPTNPLADRPYTKPVTLKALRALSNPPRIIALSGTSDRLEEALKGLSMLGRRLQQARVFVVIVPTDGSKPSDFEALGPVSPKSWLVEASDQSAWQDYFRSLSADDDAPIPSFQWFGLNSSGKSFGSGQDIPLWLQVLGQHLRPIEFLDESDLAAEKIDATLLTSLNSFYDALTTGSLENINDIFSKQTSSQVSEVIEGGGRIDSWADCLAEGARPEDMQISGADSFMVSDIEAYTTTIEFPANAGFDSATLLAVQKWTRKSKTDDWKLSLHETIPWCPETKAQGTLRCDCRGCVALTRGPERRTFGGVIG